jgi:hypothetical protein
VCRQLGPKLQAGLGNLGLVQQHLDGFRHRTELLDHAVPELGGEPAAVRGYDTPKYARPPSDAKSVTACASAAGHRRRWRAKA